MARHGEDQVRVFHDLAREQARAMAGEIEAPFERHEVGAFGGRRPVPGARCRPTRPSMSSNPRSTRRGAAAPRPAGCGRCSRCRRRESRFTARAVPAPARSSASEIAPERTTRGDGTGAIDHRRRWAIAEHATIQHEQPARSLTAAAKSRRMASAPGAGGLARQIRRGGRQRLAQRRDEQRHPRMRCPAHRDAPFRSAQRDPAAGRSRPAAPASAVRARTPGPGRGPIR